MKKKKINLMVCALIAFQSNASDFNVIINSDQAKYDVDSISELIEYTEWSNKNLEYSCTTPTPLLNTIYKGTMFKQTHDCSQDQERTKNTYYVYSNSERKDLISTEKEEKTIIVNKEKNEIGTFLATSCKEILESSGSTGDGNYQIYPSSGQILAYCDMTTDSGGWTLVGRSKATQNPRLNTCNSADADYSAFGWVHEMGTLSNDSAPYSMAVLNKSIDFNEVLFGDYNSGKNWGDWVYKHNLSKTDLVSLNSTTRVIGVPTAVKGNNQHFSMAQQIGESRKNHFFFRDSTVYSMFGLMADGWYSCYGDRATNNHATPAIYGGNINYAPGMVFVR